MIRKVASAIIVIAAVAAVSSAATVWTGASDSDWANSANWDNSTPGDAVFDAAAANQPDTGSSASATTVSFNSGGWTVSSSDGAGSLGQLSLWAGSGTNAVASNSGVNVVDANLFFSAYANTQLYVEAGSTMIINGNVTGRRDWHAYGSGSYIFNGNVDKLLADYGSGNYLFNCPDAVSVFAPTIAAGSTFGGTAPVMRIADYSSLTFENGGIFSPGGDGVNGELISTLTLGSTGTHRSGLDMGGELSKMVMDIGSELGSNDHIIVDFPADKLKLDLKGCELALRGEGAIADGDYTLISETGAGAYQGVFGNVTYNGSVLPSENYALTYNADSVVVTLTGIVPEPATMSLLLLGGVAVFRRKR